MGKLVPNTFNLLVVIAVALGSTACSYGMSVISSTIGQPSFYTDLGLAPQGDPGYARTSQLIGAFNGVNSAGSAIAAPFTAWSANKIGRLRTIELGAVITIIGGALCAGSVNVAMFLVARFIAGWGVGTLITAIPMYQAEVSTPESRGFMVSMHGIMFAVGYSLSAWIGFGCYFLSASGSTSSFPWRFPLAFQMVPAALLLACSKWLPYSPRWLMAQGRFSDAHQILVPKTPVSVRVRNMAWWSDKSFLGRMDEAHDVIRKLHRTKDDAHDTKAAKEFFQMRKQLELDRQINDKVGVFDIFATKPNRRRAYVGFTLMLGNQFTGVLIIANYGVLLYSSLGMETFMPLLLSALWVTLSFPGNVFTALFIDRIGRRTFMLIGITGLLISLIFEAALQAQFLGTANKAGEKAAIYFIFQFVSIPSCMCGMTRWLTYDRSSFGALSSMLRSICTWPRSFQLTFAHLEWP